MKTSCRPSRLRLIINDADLCDWLAEATGGAIRQYHRGFLPIDVDPHSGRMSEPDRDELLRVAKRARWASNEDLVHLVQRRHGCDDYAYLLVKRPARMIASASLSGRSFDPTISGEDAGEVEA